MKPWIKLEMIRCSLFFFQLLKKPIKILSRMRIRVRWNELIEELSTLNAFLTLLLTYGLFKGQQIFTIEVAEIEQDIPCIHPIIGFPLRYDVSVIRTFDNYIKMASLGLPLWNPFVCEWSLLCHAVDMLSVYVYLWYLRSLPSFHWHCYGMAGSNAVFLQGTCRQNSLGQKCSNSCYNGNNYERVSCWCSCAFNLSKDIYCSGKSMHPLEKLYACSLKTILQLHSLRECPLSKS